MTNDDQFHKDFEKALSFATRLHAKQNRKGATIPYISHLISVAGIVLENGGGRDEAIAALLHDSIEDQSDSYTGGAYQLRSDITELFGSSVLDIVEGCTDADTIPKPPWRERKESYIAYLTKASAAIRLVSCADKVHNARAILSDFQVVGNALWRRFGGGREGTLWYYRSLADTFMRLGPERLAGELNRTVLEIENLTSSPRVGG